MRMSKAPLLLLSLLVAACTADTAPTAPKSANVVAANRSATPAPVSRPFSGECELTFTPPPFPMPPAFQQTDIGTCHFTALGRTSYYGVQQINVVAGTQSGERTLTAANGDILRLTHVGTSAPIGPGLVSFQATLTIIGGTGRFTNATGLVHGSGVANLITRTTVATFEGSITYDASNRSRP